MRKTCRRNGEGSNTDAACAPQAKNIQTMKIKRILYRSVFVAAAAVLTSCGTNWLDESPNNAVDAEGAIKNVSDLINARIGMYKAFKGTSGLTDYYSQQMFVYGDVHGDDMQYNNVYGSNHAGTYYYMEYTTASSFGRTTTPWQSPYITIGRACRIIEAAEAGTMTDAEESAADIAQIEAEARVLRAYCLFDLTRIYGKPYTMDGGESLGASVVTSSLESTDKPARSSVKDCYTQILKDLNTAISSNALYDGTDDTGYINVWAAKALLVRVYLTMGGEENLKNALDTAQDIIANSPYTLWTPSQYATAWDKRSAAHGNEMIFEIAITGTNDWTDRNGISYLCDPDGYGDVIVTKSFYDMMQSDPQDARNGILIAGAENTQATFGDARPYINKFQDAADTRLANLPMLRLSEVYLSAAEAAFALNKKDIAVPLLNAIISNRTTDASKLVNETTITDERIATERRKELVGEGQRYFDLLRRGEQIVRYTDVNNRGWHDILAEDARAFDRTSYKAYPAIPQYEVNANKNIQQNDGYGK